MNIIKNFKNNLLTFDNQKLTKWSIFMLVILDIFLLVAIFTGISSETKMAPDEHLRYPISCNKHFLNNEKTKRDYFYFDKGYYGNSYSSIQNDLIIADSCKELEKKINVFTGTKDFKTRLKLIRHLDELKRENLVKIEAIETRYNTNLFEKISDKSTNIHNTKKKYYDLMKEEQDIKLQRRSIESIDNLPGFSDYLSYISENKESFKKAYKKYQFWQPFYEYAYILKFTLPLLLISFLMYRFARRKENVIIGKIINIISSHLILILSIPVLIGTLTLIFKVIPHKIMKKIMAFLYDFGIIFLGYYGIIGIIIIIFGTLIFYIQKKQKIKTEESKYLSSYQKSKCPNCNLRIEDNQIQCHNCDEKLRIRCSKCNNLKLKNFKHCGYCED